MNYAGKNYRKRTNKAGKDEYFAFAEGQWVQVSKKVYTVLTQMDRRMRYLDETLAQAGRLSVERLTEEFDGSDEIPVSWPVELSVCSAEDVYFGSRKEENERAFVKRLLENAGCLPEEERHFILLFLNQIAGERQVARLYGLPKATVHRRKRRILDALIRQTLREVEL